MPEPEGVESIPSLPGHRTVPYPLLLPFERNGKDSPHGQWRPRHKNEYQTQFQNCNQIPFNQRLMLFLAQTQFGFALAFHAIPRPAKADNPSLAQWPPATSPVTLTGE